MVKIEKLQEYTMTAKVGRYPSETTAWYLVEIPKKLGQEIYEKFGKLHRGFGSLPVSATVGQTTWRTSIFRSNRTISYMLFLKATVRKKEAIEVGAEITVTIALIF